MELVKVTTDSGFECEIEKDRLDDWEFAEAVVAATESRSGGESLKLAVYMINHMMSPKDAARLKDHVRLENGRVPSTRIMDEVTDIFNKIGLKN